MMAQPTRPQATDVIVVGAGPVGEVAAERVAAAGLAVVIIEAELAGGECSYWACIPSKALLRGPAALQAATAVPGARQAVTGDLDATASIGWREELTASRDDAGQIDWLTSSGVNVVRGRGRLSGDREVTVTHNSQQQRWRAHHAVVIATGSQALIPDIPGLREARPWTNRQAMEATEVPESLAVIGGGAVGCELAYAFAALGAAVTMLVRESVVLEGAEPFAGELVAAGLREAGVSLHFNTQAQQVERLDTGEVRIATGGAGELRVAQVLVATGRSPRTDLGVDQFGLTEGDWLSVDDSLRVVDGEGRVVAPWLYAVGDVNHRQLLTHQGKYQARAAAAAIVARAHGEDPVVAPWSAVAATADDRASSRVIFTVPQVASVGLTAEQARAAGHEVTVVDESFDTVAGATVYGEGYTGQARLVIDPATNVVVGATFVGPEVAELLHAATIAITAEVPIDRLWHAVPAFPTLSEIWLRLLEAHRAS